MYLFRFTINYFVRFTSRWNCPDLDGESITPILRKKTPIYKVLRLLGCPTLLILALNQKKKRQHSFDANFQAFLNGSVDETINRERKVEK